VKLFIGLLILALAAACSGGTSTVDSPPASAAQPAAPAAPEFDTMDYRIRVATVADHLEYPYSMTFLPDSDLLLTEMPGRVRLIRDGKLLPDPVATVPGVHHDKASKGLMDIALHPKFAENHFVYLTYNKAGEKGVTEVVARGVFDGSKLTDIKDVFVADAWTVAMGRQNSRIAFGRDGMLYMTVSVGGGGPQTARAQQMTDHAGKILRLRDDGSVPPDNPFVGRAGYRPEIFSYGHQNIHALVVNPETGDLWGIEHGDEANIIRAGGNYGWPYVSVGGSGGASGTPQPTMPKPPNIKLEDPYIEWKTPDIHPTGLAFYTADKFPKWKESIFVGGLSTEQLHRTALTKDGAGVQENLFSKFGQWLRDVKQGPDGLIYFTTYDDPDAPGRVMRIEPVS
jgi:aldose sugar dehydrogenase